LKGKLFRKCPGKLLNRKRGKNRNIDNTKRFKTQVINKIKEPIKSTFRKSKQKIIQPANQRDIYVDNSGKSQRKPTLF